VVEDVASTGQSAAHAIQVFRDSGLSVIGAITIVDREEGAREFLLNRFGIELMSLTTLKAIKNVNK